MKFSFLIPSKNRLALLRHAVDSVLRERCANYEIVIADNASHEDYPGYVQSLGDAPVVYRRSPEPLSVTANWRAALDSASGDYILMLGDDDALAPGFVGRALAAVEDPAPDIVYLAAFHYCYPGVLPGHETGYLAEVLNSRFLPGKSRPFVLALDEARAVAEAAFSFRYLFAFNSQHFLFRAEFLRELEGLGGPFQSPYPDTFAATVSFLTARRIVVVPEPSVVIGISPKSFGYYYFNDRATEGYEFLDNADVSREVRDALVGSVLPGDQNNTNWLVAVEVSRRALAAIAPLRVDVKRYRQLQMAAFLRSVYVKRARSVSEVPEFAAKLDASERADFDNLAASLGRVSNRRAAEIMKAVDRALGQFWPAAVRMLDIGEHSNISDALQWLGEAKRPLPERYSRHPLWRILGFK
jgi:glycosyltransferase involved in cell wall biosynthesis